MWDLDHKTGWMPKNWASELWCLIIFLRGPYTTRGSNQSIWKEINFWPLLSQLRHLLRASRWKEWMLPLQKCLTMAAPSKEFVAPPLEEAQKGWRLCVPWFPRYMCCILPSSIGGQGRGILGRGGGGWLRDLPGPSLVKSDWKGQSRHMWQRAGDWGVETRGNQVCMNYLTQTPLEEKPSDKIIWDVMKRVYFITP